MEKRKMSNGEWKWMRRIEFVLKPLSFGVKWKWNGYWYGYVFWDFTGRKKKHEGQSEPVSIEEEQINFRYDLFRLYDRVQKAKPNDRSDKDRHWAIVKTEVEKLLAYVNTWLMP